jgi:hypothetical protein
VRRRPMWAIMTPGSCDSDGTKPTCQLRHDHDSRNLKRRALVEVVRGMHMDRTVPAQRQTHWPVRYTQMHGPGTCPSYFVPQVPLRCQSRPDFASARRMLHDRCQSLADFAKNSSMTSSLPPPMALTRT